MTKTRFLNSVGFTRLFIGKKTQKEKDPKQYNKTPKNKEMKIVGNFLEQNKQKYWSVFFFFICFLSNQETDRLNCCVIIIIATDSFNAMWETNAHASNQVDLIWKQQTVQPTLPSYNNLISGCRNT